MRHQPAKGRVQDSGHSGLLPMNLQHGDLEREKAWQRGQRTEERNRAQPAMSDRWDKAAQEVGDRCIRVWERRECPPLWVLEGRRLPVGPCCSPSIFWSSGSASQGGRGHVNDWWSPIMAPWVVGNPRVQ